MFRATFLFFLAVRLSLGSEEYQKQYKTDLFKTYVTPGYDQCNKSKVIDKVPVYDLCYWNQIEWNGFVPRSDESSCNLHGREGNYIAARSIPTKIRLYNGRVYCIIDRNVGVYSSLSYFDMKHVSRDKICPKLECFRDCKRNQLADIQTCADDTNYLINVRDIQFTSSKTAWLLDIGAYFNGCTPVYHRAPRVCLYDVSSSKASQKFCSSLPSQYYNAGNQMGFNAILVNEEYGPGKHFVYIFNSDSASITVYSEEKDKFWSIRAALLGPDPGKSLFKYYLKNHQYYRTIDHNGLYSGATDKYGLFLAPKASEDLYFCTYEVLNDKFNEDRDELSYHIKDVGTYNNYGQTSAMIRNKDVLFFIQPQTYALVCANKKEVITPDTIQYLAIDSCRFAHLTSLDLYHHGPNKKEVYLLSNNLMDIKANGYDAKQKNFVISFVDVDEVEALYPQCLSYFEEFYGDNNVKDEVAYAHLLAAKSQYEDHHYSSPCSASTHHYHKEEEKPSSCSCSRYNKTRSYYP